MVQQWTIQYAANMDPVSQLAKEECSVTVIPDGTEHFANTKSFSRASMMVTHTPHNSSWISGCNTYTCEYGHIAVSKAFWCPQRCALYATNATVAQKISTTCPPNNNCIPDQWQCAKPVCDNPVGWCMPVGMVMVDTITLPTNPPKGYVEGEGK